jgi:hypothetical protein
MIRPRLVDIICAEVCAAAMRVSSAFCFSWMPMKTSVSTTAAGR